MCAEGGARSGRKLLNNTKSTSAENTGLVCWGLYERVVVGNIYSLKTEKWQLLYLNIFRKLLIEFCIFLSILGNVSDHVNTFLHKILTDNF